MRAAVLVATTVLLGCSGQAAQPPVVTIPRSAPVPVVVSSEPSRSTASATPPDMPAVTQTAAVETERPPLRPELPRRCVSDRKPCVPPPDFVEVLCRKKYPSVALAMFAKSAPWQHVFVKVTDVAPRNALGGPAGDTRLEFLEEVVVLRERAFQTGAMEMTAPPKAYDVLRFDGTCAILAEDEFMWTRPPVRARYAPVVWQYLDPPMREVLSQSNPVDQAREGQHDACRGAFLGGGGSACKAATQQLARAIATALGRGVALPVPNSLPAWSSASEPVAPVGRAVPTELVGSRPVGR
jgi:hypothetical protein